MSDPAQLPTEPAAFLSYAHIDDDNDNGRIRDLQKLLTEEVRVKTGTEIRIFIDDQSISWGEEVKAQIRELLNKSWFLIAVLTPSFFNSPWCRYEVQTFREASRGREAHIFPLLYHECPFLKQESRDPLVEEIKKYKPFDGQKLRFMRLNDPPLKKLISRMASEICTFIWRRLPPQPSWGSHAPAQEIEKEAPAPSRPSASESYQFLNGNDRDWKRNSASREFIAAIQEERGNGYGFVPIIGDRFASPSRSPLAWELDPYLQRCLYLALVQKGELWQPRTDQWPPYIDREDHDHKQVKDGPIDWAAAISARIEELKRGPQLPEISEMIEVLQKGHKAAGSWQDALQFLARLRHGGRRGANAETSSIVSLEEVPRPEVVNSCFREVLRDRFPSLFHNMLAVLAGALRLDLILTTNLDNLLERAFDTARNRLRAMEVPLGVIGLPHWSAVSEVRSLIKIGNRDLIRHPEGGDVFEQDKITFLEYLLSGKGRSDLAQDPAGTGLDFQNHLLVVGDQNPQTLRLIEHAWQRIAPGFRVFWLCYSNANVEQAIESTQKACHQHGTTGQPSSVILRHTDFGLLLLELYQTTRKNLPPFGGLFPSVSRLSVPPLQPRHIAPKESRTSFCEEVHWQLKKFQTPGSTEKKLIAVTARDEVRGLTSACSKIFHELEEEWNSVCLWLDMNDIASTDDLFEVLLEAAYYRLGQEHWVPYFREVDQQRRGDEIRLLAKSVNRRWVIFLNARETPGANIQGPDDQLPHGWMDVPKRERNEKSTDLSNCTEKFIDLLEQLCGPDSPHISVVLMCRFDPGCEMPNLIQGLKSWSKDWKELGHPIELTDEMQEARHFSEDEIVAEAIAWTTKDPNAVQHRQRFLQTLVLMQRPRLLATLWSNAMRSKGGDRTAIVEDKQLWLDELENMDLLRSKAGGFIWLHSRCRQRIRRVLSRAEELAIKDADAIKNILERWNPKAQEPDIHTKLAEWYGKIVDASGVPAAVFEAVYHFCRAAETYLEQSDPEQRMLLACERIDCASALLRTNSYLVRTQGYARGSCRRLEYIRDTLCARISGLAAKKQLQEAKAAMRRLQLTCTEVKRSIAREVGEDAKAYLRHRQFGRLLAGDENFKEEPPRHERKEGEFLTISTKVSSGLAGGTFYPVEVAHAEWVRWWRWSGMLGMASRSYGPARRAFQEALECVRNPNKYLERRFEQSPVEPGPPLNLSRWPTRSLYSQEVSVEELRIIEESVELALVEYNLDQRLRDLKSPDSSYSSESDLDRLRKIEDRIQEGRELAVQIRSRDRSLESRGTANTNWSECLLLIHQSVCLSQRLKLMPRDEARAVDTALALLGDAEAVIRRSDPRRHDSGLAMVELHRAQARLWAAETVRVIDGMTFAAMCRKLELTSAYIDQRQNIRDGFLKREGQEGNFIEGQLRRVKSLVIDGRRFLDRAEPVLRERRRNVWWITWFFERRLRSVAMLGWASVFEQGTPIPFLGREAANSATQSQADSLLQDAVRMISVDAYRLATIVDAYASCAKSLQMRLLLDEGAVGLHSRKKNMQKNLKDALEKLDYAVTRRNAPDSKELPTNDKMDSRIEQYISEVKSRSKKIVKDLESRQL